jgi:hypothetical protein
LANGTPLVLHSVVFKDDEGSAHWNELIRNAPAGEVIEIPVPHAVIVTVPSIDPIRWAQDGHKTVVPGNVVIPLVNKANRKNTIDFGDGIKVSYKSHMHDLAFAVTYHKMQGQTVSKIILDLNRRPRSLGCLDFHAFYVGISRVKHSDHIRILPCYDLDDSFKHLLKLQPDAMLNE